MNEKQLKQLLNTVQHKIWSAFYYFPEFDIITVKREQKIAGLVKMYARSYRIRPQMVIDKVESEPRSLDKLTVD